MATLLHVDSSPRPTSSTRRLTAEYVTLFNLLAIDDTSFVHADRQRPAFPDGDSYLDDALKEIRALALTPSSAVL